MSRIIDYRSPDLGRAEKRLPRILRSMPPGLMYGFVSIVIAFVLPFLLLFVASMFFFSGILRFGPHAMIASLVIVAGPTVLLESWLAARIHRIAVTSRVSSADFVPAWSFWGIGVLIVAVFALWVIWVATHAT